MNGNMEQVSNIKKMRRSVTPEGSDYLRIPEASVYCGLSESRLRKLTAPKVAAIPVYKDGSSTIIHKRDLDAYMASKRQYTKREADCSALL